jgi:hypothetical protein
MLIEIYYNGVEIHREEKMICAKFIRPHRVLSTCRAAGGLQDGLWHIYNHQSCEPEDKFAWGVLPATCWSEVMGAYAAQVACAVGGDYDRLADYRRQLAPTRSEGTNAGFVDLACRALAVGFADKWNEKRGV